MGSKWKKKGRDWNPPNLIMEDPKNTYPIGRGNLKTGIFGKNPWIPPFFGEGRIGKTFWESPKKEFALKVKNWNLGLIKLKDLDPPYKGN